MAQYIFMTFASPPEFIFSEKTRVMFVLAHQDDEAVYAGLIQRIHGQKMFLWVTNGDGLAKQAGMNPRDYAEMREMESRAGMKMLGISWENLRFLRHSEIKIYASLVKVAQERDKRHEVFSYFRGISAQVEAEMRGFRPDVVFTLAWQGGHPEHDLCHYFAYLAASRMNGVTLFELPEYELFYTCLLRFPFWERKNIYELELTDEEVQKKLQVLGCYPSQEWLFAPFQKGLRVRRYLDALLEGKTKNPLAREFFREVPKTRDYQSPPHRVDFLEYGFDDYEGKRISFRTMLLPVIQALA